MYKVKVSSNGALSKTSGNVIYELTDDLPAGYTKLEYVQLTNTYIYTGFKTKETSVIEAKVYPQSSTSSYLWVADSSSSGSTNTTAYFSSSGNWRFGNRTINIANTSYVGAWHECKQSQDGVWIDGTKINSYSSIWSFTSTNSIRFGSSAAGATNNWAWFKHTRDGKLVSWHIACKRDSDNVAGFYDLVNDIFYEGGSAPA